MILRIFVHEKSYYVADETSTARYYNILHSNQCIYSKTNYTNHSGETITSIFVLFRKIRVQKINIPISFLMFALSLQELKGNICHSHSSTLAEHSHATYHYLSNLGDKQYLPSKLPSSPGASPRLRYMLSYFHHLIRIEV